MNKENLREDLQPYYDEADCCHYIVEFRKENQELKERLKRINNYLDKYYSMENQYWFDHIRDIVKDR